MIYDNNSPFARFQKFFLKGTQLVDNSYSSITDLDFESIIEAELFLDENGIHGQVHGRVCDVCWYMIDSKGHKECCES